MGYKISCFERILHMAEMIPKDKMDECVMLVEHIMTAPDELAAEMARDYLALVSYKEHSFSRKVTLFRGMVLYNGLDEKADIILDFEAFLKVLEHTGLDRDSFPHIHTHIHRRILLQREKKDDTEYIYSPIDRTLAKISPWENEEDLNTAISLMDEPLIEYINFVAEKNPSLTKEDMNILWEGIVRWKDYVHYDYENDDEMFAKMLEKTGVTKEAVEAYMAEHEKDGLN